MGPKKLIPTDNKLYLGIEIEFDLSDPSQFECIKSKLKDFPVIVTNEIIAWEYKKAYELAILVPQNKFKRVVIRILKVIRECGGFVNKYCGLHVHFDCRNRNQESLLKKFFANQHILFSKVSPERKFNKYCRSIFDTSDAYLHGDKAIKVDYKYDTVEIRMKEATLNSREVINWILLLISISEG